MVITGQWENPPTEISFVDEFRAWQALQKIYRMPHPGPLTRPQPQDLARAHATGIEFAAGRVQ